MSKIEIKLLKHQYELLKDIKTKIIGMVAGYGSGKTYAACEKALQLTLLNPNTVGIITEPTYPMLRDIFIPDMLSTLDKHNIDYTFNKSNSIFEIRVNGATNKILCMSAENYERLVGINAAWAIMDELDTSKIELALKAFEKILGRLRAGRVRQLIIVSTPEGFKALYKIFVTDNKGDRKLIRAKTTDNKYLPDDFIKTLKTQYPPQLLKAYLEGEFVNLASGTVYSYFNREKHNTDETIKPNDILYIGQDFNVGGCVGTIVVLRDNKPVVVSEYVVSDTHEIINYLKENYHKHKIVIVPDASSNSEKTNSSKSDMKLLKEAGFIIQAPSKNPRVRDRVNSVNNMFYRNELLVNTLRCPQLTMALEQQAYNDNGEPEKFGGAATVDDFNDALGYVIHYKFGLTAPRATIRQSKMV